MISSSGESVSTSTSKPARAEARRPHPRSSRGREPSRSRGDAGSRTPRTRAATATPRSISAPSSASDSSIAASAVAMSKTSNQPMWPMRKILPFRCPWPGASVTPWRSRRWQQQLAGVDPVGHAHRGHDGGGVVVGREELEPHRLDARRAPRGRGGRAARTPPRDCRRGASRARRRGSWISETAGVNAASSVVLRLLVRAPVEVEAARRLAARSQTCAGTDAIASPGGHISAFCEPETTTSIPQASVSSGTAPSDEIASTTSIASPTASLIARTSETTPVEVSDCWQKHDLGSATRAPPRRPRPDRAPRPTRSGSAARRARAASQIATQRSPNDPWLTTATRSPGAQRFATADSIAPVPEAVKSSTSELVRKTSLQPRRAFAA